MEEERNKKGKVAEAIDGLKGILTGKGSRISETTAFLMIGTASLFDLLSAVPIVNWVVIIFANMTFALWFLIKGVGLISPKKLAAPAIATLVEIIPAISSIPAIILAVLISIALVRVEDAGIDLPTPGAIKKPIKGGRGRLAKVRRRASQTPEHNREARRRLHRIRANRNRREVAPARKPSFDGITRLKPAWQN